MESHQIFRYVELHAMLPPQQLFCVLEVQLVDRLGA
jgi:hypothetical protein